MGEAVGGVGGCGDGGGAGGAGRGGDPVGAVAPHRADELRHLHMRMSATFALPEGGLGCP